MLNRTRRVVLLGDSISVGTFPFLEQALKHDQGPGRTQAMVVAKVGAPTSWMRSMSVTVLEMEPTVVLVMGGTNDIAGGESGAAERAIDNLIDVRLVLGRTPVIFSTIPPRTDEPGRKRTAAFNARLLDTEQTHLSVVDVGGSLPPDLIGPDHVHPTMEGYRELGERWAATLREPGVFLGAVSLLLPLGVAYGAARAMR